jgi:hypothetical protein
MFDLGPLAAVDPHADEAALIEQIAWLERVKSAAAAGQARAAAALDEKRRADEAAAGVPTAKQGRGVLSAKQRPMLGGQAFGWDRKAGGSSVLVAVSLALWGVDCDKPARPRRSGAQRTAVVM